MNRWNTNGKPSYFCSSVLQVLPTTLVKKPDAPSNPGCVPRTVCDSIPRQTVRCTVWKPLRVLQISRAYTYHLQMSIYRKSYHCPKNLKSLSYGDVNPFVKTLLTWIHHPAIRDVHKTGSSHKLLDNFATTCSWISIWCPGQQLSGSAIFCVQPGGPRETNTISIL